MTRLYVVSRPIAPRYQSAPYRMRPARRQHVHGPIHPLHSRTAETAFLRLVAIGLVSGALLLGVLA